MKHRAVMEFYLDATGFVVRLETDAAPPAIGAKLNFRRRDYIVEDVDYSIDSPGEPFPETIYRRNVYLRLDQDRAHDRARRHQTGQG